MNIRKVDPAPFVRKATVALDEMTRSWPVAITASLRYGRGEVAKVGHAGLAARTDEHGDLGPYAADDPDVLRKLFGVETD